MSIIKKISEKIFGVKNKELEQLTVIVDKALLSQENLQFKIAKSLQESKKITQNLNNIEIRQKELQDKARQFLLMSDENGAKIALQKKNSLSVEIETLRNCLKSETKYTLQLKKLFSELEVQISEMNSVISLFKQRGKQGLNYSLSSDLSSEIPNINEIKELTENTLIKSKRDEYLRALEADTDSKLSNIKASEELDVVIDNELLDLKQKNIK